MAETVWYNMGEDVEKLLRRVAVQERLLASLQAPRLMHTVVVVREVVVRSVLSTTVAKEAGRQLLQLLAPPGKGAADGAVQGPAGPATGGGWAPPAASQWQRAGHSESTPGMRQGPELGGLPGRRRDSECTAGMRRGPAGQAAGGGLAPPGDDQWQVQVNSRGCKWKAAQAAHDLASKIYQEEFANKRREAARERAVQVLQRWVRRCRAKQSAAPAAQTADGDGDGERPRPEDEACRGGGGPAKKGKNKRKKGQKPKDDDMVLEGAIKRAEEERAAALQQLSEMLAKKRNVCPEGHRLLPAVDPGPCGLCEKGACVAGACAACGFLLCMDCCEGYQASDEDEGDEQAHCGRGGPDGGLQHDHFQQWIDDGVPDDPGDLIPEDG